MEVITEPIAILLLMEVLIAAFTLEVSMVAELDISLVLVVEEPLILE